MKRHISAVVSSAPSKALATLENDAAELIASGMVTLNAKLMGLEDDKLVGRVVEIWGFFWDQVLTYVEGVRGYGCCLMSHILITCVVGSTATTDRPASVISISHTKAPIFS